MYIVQDCSIICLVLGLHSLATEDKLYLSHTNNCIEELTKPVRNSLKTFVKSDKRLTISACGRCSVVAKNDAKGQIVETWSC